MEERPMNDRREGILRDPVNYQGEIVSYVKDIGNGDQGYDASIRQVLIMKQDGTEVVVPEKDIMKERKIAPDEVHELDRRPEHTLPPAVAGFDEGAGEKNAQARPAAEERKPKQVA